MFLSVLPFLMPVLMIGYNSGLKTRVDDDGVCLQSNGINCGPAAAVTALRMLDLDGEEGELAILAYTSPVSGTPPDLLCNALTRRYAGQNLKCDYRLFKSISEMKDTKEVVIAVIKFSFLIDHYVTVMEITDDAVIVGDPLHGKSTYTREQFEEKWRHTGVVLSRGR